MIKAGVVELVDTTDSKSVAFERDGSSPSTGTNQKILLIKRCVQSETHQEIITCL